MTPSKIENTLVKMLSREARVFSIFICDLLSIKAFQGDEREFVSVTLSAH